MWDINDNGNPILPLFCRQFLALLKVCINPPLEGNRIDLCLEICKIDWEKMYEVAKEHNLVGVVFDGIECFGKLHKSSEGPICNIQSTINNLPEMDLLMDWLGQTVYIKSMYEEREKVIAALGMFMHVHGFKMMVMKGYGCAQYYPKPELRPVGDIDIITLGEVSGVSMVSSAQNGLGGRSILGKIADEVVESELGINIDRRNSHHSVFNYMGAMVENHWTILDINKHKSNLDIEEILEVLAADCVESSIPHVYLPSAEFQSIHLLRHMASDFATVRITLRHVLDWSTFVTRNIVDWDFVYEVAKKSKMDKFLNALNGICVEYLGYPSDMFPERDPNNALRDNVLAEILSPAFNEELAEARSGMCLIQKLQYGVAKTRRLFANRWKYKMVYDESLLESFWFLAVNRLKN